MQRVFVSSNFVVVVIVVTRRARTGHVLLINVVVRVDASWPSQVSHTHSSVRCIIASQCVRTDFRTMYQLSYSMYIYPLVFTRFVTMPAKLSHLRLVSSLHFAALASFPSEAAAASSRKSILTECKRSARAVCVCAMCSKSFRVIAATSSCNILLHIR